MFENFVFLEPFAFIKLIYRELTILGEFDFLRTEKSINYAKGNLCQERMK